MIEKNDLKTSLIDVIRSFSELKSSHFNFLYLLIDSLIILALDLRKFGDSGAHAVLSKSRCIHKFILRFTTI